METFGEMKNVNTIIESEDYVIKRNGGKEKMSFDKILNRLRKLEKNELNVNYTNLVQKSLIDYIIIFPQQN